MIPPLSDGKYVVLSDIQAPYHSEEAVASVTRFIKSYRPDGLLCVGDEADCPAPSRWSRGKAAEYAGDLERGLQETYDVLAGFRQALGKSAGGRRKPFHLMRSNHTQRIGDYLARYAPAMALTSWNDYRSIMGFDSAPLLAGRTKSLDITWHDEPWHFAEDWVMAHGDEGGLNRTAGGTAMGLARKWGVSVLCGHTHKLGLQHDHKSLNGRITQWLYGVEVGHLMDLRQADYLKANSANWNQGFAIVHVRHGRANVQPVSITNGFVVDGKHYR